ncbi:MAG TPA: portal protein [Dongiaceae bacterium]|nr:portal protein [Dongiaceae bacterium]
MALDIERVHRTFSTLVERRMPWESLWRDTARYYMPTSMHWMTGGGNRQAIHRGHQVFDDTPSWAANRFASAMLGMVMNPAQKWLEFELYTEHTKLSMAGRIWLTQLRDYVLSILQAPDVGFYDAYHEHLLDYGIFGEACMLIDKNPETGLPRFTPFPLEQTYIGMGAKRTPDTVFRKYEMTAQDIQDFFAANGEKLPDCVQGKLDAKQYAQKFAVIHGVFPRKHGIAFGFADKKPWASVYYLEATKEVLRESGFDFFPFSCPRFMLFASEDHGQGPGTMTLSNVKTMNAIIKTNMRADQRAAAPPYLAQRRGWIKQLNFTPDHINYYDGFDMDKALIPIGNDGKPQAGREWVQMYQDQIKRAFYLDRLMAQEKKAEVKEVEVLTNEDERMRDLVPQLSRLHSESISTVILNLVHYCMEDMPEPPPELAAQGIKLRYLSPLARAQRLLEVSNANRVLQQSIIPLGQINPDALKTVDMYKMTNWILDQSSFPSEVRVSEEEFQAQKAAEQQKVELAQGLQAAQGAAQVAKDFSTAQKNAPNAMGGFM